MSLSHGYFLQISLTFSVDWEPPEVQENIKITVDFLIKSCWYKNNASVRNVGAAKQTTIVC